MTTEADLRAEVARLRADLQQLQAELAEAQGQQAVAAFPRVAELANELAEVRADRDRLQTWVNDLHSGMFINCVYCGHRYGPSADTPVAMADVLKAHIEQCPQHPLSKLRAACTALPRYGGWLTKDDKWVKAADLDRVLQAEKKA